MNFGTRLRSIVLPSKNFCRGSFVRICRRSGCAEPPPLEGEAQRERTHPRLSLSRGAGAERLRGELAAADMPSPMRGRWHGEAVTDEVGQFRLHSVVHLISRLRRQLPLIGEATGSAEIPTPSPGGRHLVRANTENLPAKRCRPANWVCTFYLRQSF